MQSRTLLFFASLGALALGGCWAWVSERGVSDVGQTSYYAQTSWAATHRDSRNSDFTPFVAPVEIRERWSALEGAVTLLAPTIGPEGNRYVTTGRGPGTSHLHAFDADGHLLWESQPQTSLDDLDSTALGNAPLVDRAGHVYVSDVNQFWSFHSDGRLRWVVPLLSSDDPSLPGGPFVSAILTREGYVGGITGAGEVALFRRQNGRLAVPVFALPDGVAPPSSLERPGLWGNGLVDPVILRAVEDSFFGDEAQVTNTPAVHPETGRIYITAAGPLDPETGALTGLLYGLDLVNGRIEIAFASSMGGGSGTSPTISPDGTKVYAADNQGVLSAFDAETGEVVWAATGIPLAGSPGLGSDGTVYGGNPQPGADVTLVALDPADGSLRWSRSYDTFAASLLDPLPPLPPLFPTGQPIARVNSVVSSSALQGWVVLTVGYEFANPLTGVSLSQPRLTVLAAIDPADGEIAGYTELRDTNEGLISIGPDGTLHVSQGSILSSIHAFGINPLLAGLGVAAEYLSPAVAVGGVQVFEPVSQRALATRGIDWVRQLGTTALTELASSNLQAAFDAVRRGPVQLSASLNTIDAALERGEIDRRAARRARLKARRAAWLLTSARNRLARGFLPERERMRAAARIERADALLADALRALD